MKNSNTIYKPAEKYANAIMKHYAKSFYFAAKFLPKSKRKAAESIYAFCRYADNIIDIPRNRTKEELENEIEQLRTELLISYRTGESEHPIIKNFIKTVHNYQIPLKYPLELLEGVLMDLNFTRYRTFDELYLFCYRVASTVGLMMVYVLGFKSESALIYAEKMGIAMQLTNILRDIKEDIQMHRIYLPDEELKSFGVNLNKIRESEFDINFYNFMKYQVERAERYYNEAQKGIKQLSGDAQFAIYSAARIYKGILDKIKRNNFNPFLGRVFVPFVQKFAIVIDEFFKKRILLRFQD